MLGAIASLADALPMIKTPLQIELAQAGWPIRTAVRTSTQGTRSETYLVEVADREAILKIYNHRGGPPREKCLREWTALCTLRDLPCLPRPLARMPDRWLLMARLPGQTLRSRWGELDQLTRRRLCSELGSHYAHFAFVDQTPTTHTQLRASRPLPWLDDVPAALDEIRRQLPSQERFTARPAFARAATMAQILTRLPIAPSVVFKADCNIDNVLCEDDRVTGIIDWEEACIADRWILAGIVLDHTHFLDWPAVRGGFEAVAGRWSRDEEDLVLAAAYLCMWRKLIRMARGSQWYAQTDVQEERMHAIAAAMGRPDVLRR